ncbi:MAG: ABC transporter permease [Clostridiaceae bacterium]|nr:ABC transporter permease [Clostridiaceae bacterium]
MTTQPTTTPVLLKLVQTVLTGATAAGSNVFVPGDFPTWEGEYPVLLVQAPHERKESQGNGGINYDVTSTIRITGRVSAPAQAGDIGALVAEDAAWALARQIEMAVINQYQVMLPLEEMPFIDTQIKVSAEGREHFAEIVMDIGMKFYQGWEAFAPQQAAPLEEVTVTTDLTNIFDPTGTYANPPFPTAVNPVPRTAGPDGRAEGAGLDIHLPQ